MTRVLITSALPYINGVKHLGNLVGSMLPADIHARFRRQLGDEVLFLCATDEHGTPAELAALEAGIATSEYCEQQHLVQKGLYDSYHLSFDHFGRTSSPQNHRLTIRLHEQLEQGGYIYEKSILQAYSAHDQRYLPDRYVVGTCPACRSASARGDQCDECGTLLDPEELIEPRSAISGSGDVEFRRTKHLFLRQSAFAERIEGWLESHPEWPLLVRSIARKWLREGLQDRCITRDLSWGIPVPREGYAGKVFYVWFDAPIEYIAAAEEWAGSKPGAGSWRDWWDENADGEYLQFMGKDNVPFHTLSFPCTIMGSREGLRLPSFIKAFNWLTFEGGKFSTSRRRGVFMDDALEEAPADAWRWWLMANAPESDDTDFTFERFVADVNKDLADVLGNLANRILTYVERRYGGSIEGPLEPAAPEADLVGDLDSLIEELRQAHLGLRFRKAAATARSIWVLANAYLADNGPWLHHSKDPERARATALAGVNLVWISAIAAWPFVPALAERIFAALGREASTVPLWPAGSAAEWILAPALDVRSPELLFRKIDPASIEDLKRRFAGQSAAVAAPPVAAAAL